MLNKKFASIRATANEKTEKRSSVASSSIINQQQQQQQQSHQRLSQSQSMEMFSGGVNYHQTNNEILMNIRSSPSLYDQRASLNSSSSPTIPAASSSPHLRGGVMKAPPHAYVNLLHQQQYHHNNNLTSPQHLQYQNTSSGSMVFGSPIILDPSSSNNTINNNNNGTCQNQSWNTSLNSLNNSTASPLVTHYTAAQIYMRPKNLLQQQQQSQPSNSSSPIVSHKKPPPDVPKRLSSVVQTAMKKTNGLSRSGECQN